MVSKTPNDLMFSSDILYTCPLCGSDTMPVGAPETQADCTVSDIVKCEECGSTFEEVYVYAGFRIVDRGVGEVSDDGETRFTSSKLDLQGE